MKPRAWNSTLPQRTKALTAKGTLKTRTALKAVSAPKRSAAKRKTSRPHSFSATVCALIDARDIDLLSGERCCQWCASTQDLERHHRRGKASGGSQRRAHTHCACNGITLCRHHHRLAHGRLRRVAEAMGFVVSQAVKAPGIKGVMRFATAGGGATQWPACDGRWLDEAEAGEEAA